MKSTKYPTNQSRTSYRESGCHLEIKMYGVSINVVIYCECVGIPIIHVIRQRAHTATAIMHTEKAMPVCDITWQGFIQDFLLGEETIDHR